MRLATVSKPCVSPCAKKAGSTGMSTHVDGVRAEVWLRFSPLPIPRVA